MQSDLVLQFREQGFYLFPLPLCACEGWCLRQLAGTLPSGFMHVDGKTAEGRAGALRPLRACPTTFAGSDVGIGAVAITPAAVVEWLPCGICLISACAPWVGAWPSFGVEVFQRRVLFSSTTD